MDEIYELSVKDLHKKFEEELTSYVESLKTIKDHKYCKISGSAKTPEDQFTKGLTRLGQYIHASGFPQPSAGQINELFNTSKSYKEYYHNVDVFLSRYDKNQPRLLEITKNMRDWTASQQYIVEVEENLNQLEKVIDSKEYTWEEKRKILKDVYFQSQKEQPPLPDIDQYIPEVENPAKAKQWLVDAGKIIGRNAKTPEAKKAAAKRTGEMYAYAINHIEENKAKEKLADLGRDFYSMENTGYRAVDRIKYAFESMRDEYSKPLVYGGKDPVTSQEYATEIGNASKDLFEELTAQNPLMNWDNEQMDLITQTLTMLETVNPKVIPQLKETYGIKGENGRYEITKDNEILEKIADHAKTAIKAIKDADPMLMKSSSQYKQLRKDAEQMDKMASEFWKAEQNGTSISQDKIDRLLSMTYQTENSGKAYVEYKVDALGRKNAIPNDIERKRIAAGQNSVVASASIREEIRNYTIEHNRAYGPMGVIEAVDKQLDNLDLSSKETIAQKLYLDILKKSKPKPSMDVVEQALEMNTMEKGVKAIMESPAFKNAMEEADFIEVYHFDTIKKDYYKAGAKSAPKSEEKNMSIVAENDISKSNEISNDNEIKPMKLNM